MPRVVGRDQHFGRVESRRIPFQLSACLGGQCGLHNEPAAAYRAKKLEKRNGPGRDPARSSFVILKHVGDAALHG